MYWLPQTLEIKVPDNADDPDLIIVSLLIEVEGLSDCCLRIKTQPADSRFIKDDPVGIRREFPGECTPAGNGHAQSLQKIISYPPKRRKGAIFIKK
jgi:hypothetical protein